MISMTAPIELPAYAAENGPYIMSMRAISDGATSPHRGPPIVLLFAMSAVSGTPSAKMRLRALELTPHVRVAIVACVSPLFRFLRNTLGRYFTASSVSMRFTVSSAFLDVMLAMAGRVTACTGVTRTGAASAVILTPSQLDGGVGLRRLAILRQHRRRDQATQTNNVAFHMTATLVK